MTERSPQAARDGLREALRVAGLTIVRLEDGYRMGDPPIIRHPSDEELDAALAAATPEPPKEFDQLVDEAKERVTAEHAALYVDLRMAVELADTRTGVVEEKDGMVEVYSLRASDWNRVVAVARGSISQKARRSLDRFQERVFKEATRG